MSSTPTPTHRLQTEALLRLGVGGGGEVVLSCHQTLRLRVKGGGGVTGVAREITRMTHGELFQQFVGNKEVESWVDWKVERLHE